MLPDPIVRRGACAGGAQGLQQADGRKMGGGQGKGAADDSQGVVCATCAGSSKEIADAGKVGSCAEVDPAGECQVPEGIPRAVQLLFRLRADVCRAGSTATREAEVAA